MFKRLFAALFGLTVVPICAMAQDPTVKLPIHIPRPLPPNLPYPTGSQMTFEWVYSCSGGNQCVFKCSDADPNIIVGASFLDINLGTIPVGSQTLPALFVFYSQGSYSNSIFVVGGANQHLACKVTGMTLNYSGPPKP
jgi:hypothetical protein